MYIALVDVSICLQMIMYIVYFCLLFLYLGSTWRNSFGLLQCEKPYRQAHYWNFYLQCHTIWSWPIFQQDTMFLFWRTTTESKWTGEILGPFALYSPPIIGSWSKQKKMTFSLRFTVIKTKDVNHTNGWFTSNPRTCPHSMISVRKVYHIFDNRI